MATCDHQRAPARLRAEADLNIVSQAIMLELHRAFMTGSAVAGPAPLPVIHGVPLVLRQHQHRMHLSAPWGRAQTLPRLTPVSTAASVAPSCAPPENRRSQRDDAVTTGDFPLRQQLRRVRVRTVCHQHPVATRQVNRFICRTVPPARLC